MPLDYDLRTTRRPVPRQLDLNGDWSLGPSRSKAVEASLASTIAPLEPNRTRRSLETTSAVPSSSLQRPLPTSETNLYDSKSTLSAMKSKTYRQKPSEEGSGSSFDSSYGTHSKVTSSSQIDSVASLESERWRSRPSLSATSSNQDDNDDSQQGFSSRYPRNYDTHELATPPRRQTSEFTSHRAIRRDLNVEQANPDSVSASRYQQSDRVATPMNSDPFLTPQRKQRTEKELPDGRISLYRPMPRSAAGDLNSHLERASDDKSEVSTSDSDPHYEWRDSNRVEDLLSRVDNYSWSRRATSIMSTASPSVQEQANDDDNTDNCHLQCLSSEGGGSPRRAWSDSSISPTSPVSSSARCTVPSATKTPSAAPMDSSLRISSTSKQSLQSMADRREAIYEFRKRMRKAFDHVENMVEIHRDFFAKRDTIANEPIYDAVMAQQAESLASEVFADLKCLRDQFQGLTLQSQAPSTTIEQSEASTVQPKDAGFLASSSVLSSIHSSCHNQDDDDTSTQDQKDRQSDEDQGLTSTYSITSPPVSPSSSISTSNSFDRAANVSFSHDDVSSIDTSSSYRSGFSQDTHSTANDRENVFKDFDQRMEEIRASLQSIAKGRSSQKEQGLGNQMEERRRNIRMRTEQQEQRKAGSSSQSQSDAHLLRLLQELSQADAHLSSPTRS